MRFKQYLMENNGITFDGFLHSLNTMIERKLFLWRGMYFQDGKKLGNSFVEFESDEDDFTIADRYDVGLYHFAGRTSDRESVTGDSTILNVISKWKGFPNRKRSYFATQSRNHIGKFGSDSALIIPADHPNLFGYMPYDVNEADIGSKAFRTEQNLRSVGTLLYASISNAREHYQDGNESSKLRNTFIEVATQTNTLALLKEPVTDRLNGGSFEMAVRFSDTFAKRMNKIGMKAGDIGWPVHQMFDRLYEEVESQGYSLVGEFLDDIKPADFEASAHTLQNLPVDPDADSNNEIWFEGPYIAIKRYDLLDFNEDKLVKFLTILRDKVQKDHELSKKVEV
jgi:hypothetical protein